MNAREGIKTKRRKLPTFDVAPIKLKTMNAREGIKTQRRQHSRPAGGLLKTMNAREGIKTQ